MAYKVSQHIFPRDEANFYASNFADGPIIKLGIQSLPGIKFLINNTEEIVLGPSGIYEFDLDGELEINSLSFTSSTLAAIKSNPVGSIIVDIVSKV